MKNVPVKAVPAQTLSTTLSDQVVGLRVYQRRTGLYMDVYKDGALVVGGVICQNLNRIVRSEYLGFVGDLVWFDTRGSADPSHDGLGDRFQLLYLTPAEVEAALA